MRIVFFTNSYKPTISGVVTSIELMRKGLTQAGHEVHIVAPHFDGFQHRDPCVLGLPAFKVSSTQKLALPLPIKAPIRAVMRDLQPTVIHSQHPTWVGDLAVSFARELGVPLVFTYHTRYKLYARHYLPVAHDLVGSMTQRVVQKHLARCAHVIAPTASIRDLVRDSYALEAPLSVVPTPVDLSAYEHLNAARVRSALGLAGAEVLLYVGRLAGEKNLRFLLNAFARVVAQRPRARLLLVGRGPDEGRLRRLARDLELGEQVLFGGAVPHDQIPHYAALADVFVFPSLTDTQGLVLIEALAAGTPVVAIDAPGSRDVLAPGGGVLVPPREQDFAAAVLGVLGDPQRRHSLEREARQIAGRYSLSAATSGLLEVYAQALEHAALKNPVRGSKERATEPQAGPRPAAWAGMAWAGLSRKRIWSRAGKR